MHQPIAESEGEFFFLHLADHINTTVDHFDMHLRARQDAGEVELGGFDFGLIKSRIAVTGCNFIGSGLRHSSPQVSEGGVAGEVHKIDGGGADCTIFKLNELYVIAAVSFADVF